MVFYGVLITAHAFPHVSPDISKNQHNLLNYSYFRSPLTIDPPISLASLRNSLPLISLLPSSLHLPIPLPTRSAHRPTIHPACPVSPRRLPYRTQEAPSRRTEPLGERNGSRHRSERGTEPLGPREPHSADSRAAAPCRRPVSAPCVGAPRRRLA